MSAAGGLALDTATVRELHQAMAGGELSSVALTETYLGRIDALDARIGAVIAVHPRALDDAAASDDRRRSGAPVRPLEGIPILIKDNIAVGGLPTTAGSRALRDSRPPDAPLVARLRGAGAVILGKANLSEWANFRDEHSTSGWSAVGGQTRNPHALDRNPSGSSSGSAAAVAASLTHIAIGSETDGSIVSPAGICGVVGGKPTLGGIPTEGVVPISAKQDTAGPMARQVMDAALTWAVLAGVAPPHLRDVSLAGKRFAIWRHPGADAATAAVLEAVVGAVTVAGATVHDIHIAQAPIEQEEWPALIAEFRHDIDAYLAHAPGAHVRDLTQLIAFDEADTEELEHFGQGLFEQALTAPGPDDPAYRQRRATATARARDALDTALADADAILTLSNDPAWRIDYQRGDSFHVSTSAPAAVAGYPSISVPGGFVGVLPVGVSLIGSSRAEARLWQLAYAVEQTVAARRPPSYRASAD